jgi:hypothetical protein
MYPVTVTPPTPNRFLFGLNGPRLFLARFIESTIIVRAGRAEHYAAGFKQNYYPGCTLDVLMGSQRVVMWRAPSSISLHMIDHLRMHNVPNFDLHFDFIVVPLSFPIYHAV